MDFAKALLNHNDKGVTGIYARWHMSKRSAKRACDVGSAATVNSFQSIAKSSNARFSNV